ncbi:MAG: LemA family protein [Odoribacter sp.]|nr:LemA family protein [Odoribacter sp.]
MLTLIIFIALILFGVATYNNLVRKKNNVDNAFGSIDAMLKKRFDLIPNLVATVQQYAEHEKQTFATITDLRAKSYSTLKDDEKAEFDRNFTAASRKLFMVAENYPQLKASENFIQLQRTLNETEEQLSASRRTFNACVTEYNNAVMTFPTNLLAGMFGFTKKEVFSIPETERSNPQVKDLFKS